jgi:DNA polymerase-4
VGDLLTSRWGSATSIGRTIADVVEGRHASIMHYDRVEQSISRDTTFAADTADPATITATLYYLTERCCKTLRRRRQRASIITVKVRFADFSTVQKQVTLHTPTAHEEDVFGIARQLLVTLLPPRHFVRLVGIKVSHLAPSEGEGSQLDLDVIPSQKLGMLHSRLDALQEKHGYGCIHWGITHSLRRWGDAKRRINGGSAS